MNIIGICAAAVAASVLAVLLKKHNAEISLILSICTVTLIAVYLISDMVMAVGAVKEIIAQASVSTEYIVILLKCVGICFITEFSCDCCKDASQQALSSAVLTGGRICVLLTALPLFEEFLNLALSLSGGGI
ncbi:MAG: SpoIIIAC/SpoIIIAD family protein [Ruminococcus sp.]